MPNGVYWLKSFCWERLVTDIVKRILCLANSRKGGDRCIAGREILPDGRPGPWVRPVSSRANEAVSKRERRYRDGSEPRLLDVVDVPVIKAHPSEYQSENWLLDPGRRWERITASLMPTWPGSPTVKRLSG